MVSSISGALAGIGLLAFENAGFSYKMDRNALEPLVIEHAPNPCIMDNKAVTVSTSKNQHLRLDRSWIKHLFF